MTYLLKMQYFDAERVFVMVIDESKPVGGRGKNDPILYQGSRSLRFYKRAVTRLGQKHTSKIIRPVSLPIENFDDLKVLLKWYSLKEADEILEHIATAT